MLTDWLIVRRLATELDRSLCSARIREAGRIADGRLGLRVAGGVVSIDAFGPTPIVAIERDIALDRAAGWVRTMADALEGLRIDAVRARRGDRLVAFECSSRSRFGIESAYRLVLELVPRFGNIVLLKDDRVVSAAKEFPRRGDGRRATVVGELYEPPPLPQLENGGVSLADVFAALAREDTQAARVAAGSALRCAAPLVPRLVADSLVAEFAPLGPDTMQLPIAERAFVLAERATARARALVVAIPGDRDARGDRAEAGDRPNLGDVYAYRENGRLVQCHVIALAQYAALACTREPALLPLLAENVGRATRARAAGAFDARRASLRGRIDKRRAIFLSERAALERERDDASGRDALRRAGESLYAHLAEIPARATSFVPPGDPGFSIALDPELDAKANAAAIFKRYRKATTKLEHVAKRLGELARDARFADTLAWELERAEPETLDEVADGIARLERRKTAPPRERARKRKPLDVRVADDARAYVGRSPVGNADLTFRIARPDDLWFHAREMPGAHVVLRIDSARLPTAHELAMAAGLAAYHSRARQSEKVSVDYTERKHVRRQQNAPPGLVWYTNARTLLVRPQAEPAPNGTVQ